jgi:hypothetical protein
MKQIHHDPGLAPNLHSGHFPLHIGIVRILQYELKSERLKPHDHVAGIYYSINMSKYI